MLPEHESCLSYPDELSYHTRYRNITHNGMNPAVATVGADSSLINAAFLGPLISIQLLLRSCLLSIQECFDSCSFSIIFSNKNIENFVSLVLQNFMDFKIYALIMSLRNVRLPLPPLLSNAIYSRIEKQLLLFER